MQILSNPILAALHESPKFLHLLGNWGQGTWWWRQILDEKWKYGCFAHVHWKTCNITIIYGRITEISASEGKSVLRNMIVTSEFWPEVEIWSFHACTMHLAIIVGTFRSLWTWLCGRYHVPQNVFLFIVLIIFGKGTTQLNK